MDREKVVELPLMTRDEDGEPVVFVQNLAKRFSVDIMYFLDEYRGDESFVDYEITAILSMAPKVMSLLEKRKIDYVGEPITREEMGAFQTYLSWSYSRNEGLDIRSGTSQPTNRSSYDMRELFRETTGWQEDTATYAVPVYYYRYNQVEIVNK